MSPTEPVTVRHGVLTIRLSSARNLDLPDQLPHAIEDALKSTQGQSAASVTTGSVLEERNKKFYAPATESNVTNSNGNGNNGTSDRAHNRESVQRKQCWWLPYVVLGFDNNEIMVDALGGDVNEPVWMYAAHL